MSETMDRLKRLEAEIVAITRWRATGRWTGAPRE